MSLEGKTIFSTGGSRGTGQAIAMRCVAAGANIVIAASAEQYELMRRDAKRYAGHFFIDEGLLRETGVTDFSHYAVDPTVPLVQDLFVQKSADSVELFNKFLVVKI